MSNEDMFCEPFAYDIYNCKFNEPIKIIPYGCIHYGAETHAKKKHLAFLREQKNAKDRRFYMGLGDYFDTMRATLRKLIKKAEIEGGSEIKLIKDAALHEADEYLALLDKHDMLEKMIIWMDGNHTYELPTGITTTEYMAQKSKTRYGGGLALFRLRLNMAGKKNATMPIDVFAFHGRSAGMYLGTKLNELQRKLEAFDAQIVVAAHAHELVTGKKQRVRLVNDRQNNKLVLKDEEVVLCRCGSFLKSYMPGKKSYAVKKVYSPAALGMPYITIIPRRQESTVKGKRTTKQWLELKSTI